MLFNVMKPGEDDTKDEDVDKNYMKQISSGSGEKKLTKESKITLNLLFFFYIHKIIKRQKS